MPSLLPWLAAAPIAVIVVLLALRVHTLVAVIIGLGSVLLLNPWFPLTGPALLETSDQLAGTTLSVVLIMFGGILLSEFLSASGAQDRISDWLGAAAGTRQRAVLLLALVATPLIESLIGWGVGVIVGVPLLMRAGLSPTRAATSALLGQTLCPWGALAPGLLLTHIIGGVEFAELGVWTAIANLPVLIVMGLAVVVAGLERGERRRALPELALLTVVMWVALLAVNAWLTPALAGILSAVAGGAVLLAASRIRSPLPRMQPETLRALAPYGLLVTGMLLAVGVDASIDLGTAGAIITNPALWLLVTAAAAPLMLRIDPYRLADAVRRGLRLWLPVCAITVLFIAFGGLLSANGMSDTLARTAEGLGFGFVLLMPFMGSLGGALTGSNTSSAAMFALSTADASRTLAVNSAMTLGAQTAAAGAAVMLSPARVVLATGIATARRDERHAPADVRWALTHAVVANLAVLAVITAAIPLVATLV